MSFPYIIALFLMGMIAGTLVALPYGPVGFLIVRRFYLFGMISGMVSALGMALSDGFYAVVVGFGLHGIIHVVRSFAIYGEIALGVLLVYIGIRAMKKKLEIQIDEEKKHPMRDLASAFLINILNPSLIVWFALAFSIFGHLSRRHLTRIGTGISIVGILAGACLLWFVIGKGIQYLRRNNRDEVVHRINYYTGAVLAGLGVILLVITIVSRVRI